MASHGPDPGGGLVDEPAAPGIRPFLVIDTGEAVRPLEQGLVVRPGRRGGRRRTQLGAESMTAAMARAHVTKLVRLFVDGPP